jgi:site-specific DNA-adenine methylase
MKFIGSKDLRLVQELIIPNIPGNIKTWCEPFGGSYTFKHVNLPVKNIYNDIKTYDIDIQADVIEHMDYIEFIDKYDTEDTLFYLDPPYYLKEHWYDLKKGDKEFHITLCNKLKNIKGKFILSYEDNLFIRRLYSEFKVVKYSGDKFNYRNEIIILK